MGLIGRTSMGVPAGGGLALVVLAGACGVLSTAPARPGSGAAASEPGEWPPNE